MVIKNIITDLVIQNFKNFLLLPYWYKDCMVDLLSSYMRARWQTVGSLFVQFFKSGVHAFEFGYNFFHFSHNCVIIESRN